MELVNDAYRLKDGLYGDPAGDAALRFATATAASLIFPFAPHLGSEVYERMTGERVWEQGWPEADEAMLVSDTVTLIVQVNGKLRDRIEAPAEAPQEELLALAKASEKVAKYLDGKADRQGDRRPRQARQPGRPVDASPSEARSGRARFW